MKSPSRLASLAVLTVLLAGCNPFARLLTTDQPVERDRREVQARTKMPKVELDPAREDILVAEFVAIKGVVPSIEWSRAVRRSLPSVIVVDPATNKLREEEEVLVYAMFTPDQGLATRKEDILQNIKSSGWHRFTPLDTRTATGSQFVFRKMEDDGFRLLIVMEKSTQCIERDDGSFTCLDGETGVYVTNVIHPPAAMETHAAAAVVSKSSSSLSKKK